MQNAIVIGLLLLMVLTNLTLLSYIKNMKTMVDYLTAMLSMREGSDPATVAKFIQRKKMEMERTEAK